MNIETITTDSKIRPLNLGFLGMGWIGKHRLNALINKGIARAAVISDISEQNAIEVALTDTVVCSSLEKLLENKSLDGVVIATPSALHAQQAQMALKAGFPVFCQKPLGRNLNEVKSVVDTAMAKDKLLGIDFSYRFLKTVYMVEKLIRCGDIGKVFAVDAVFHNAYGPDKSWFYNSELSGGGCVIDLGIHLVDLILWIFDFPSVFNVQSRLYAYGNRIRGKAKEVEDYAVGSFDLENGCMVNFACSWKLQAGTDAVIALTFYGTEGALCIRNISGSFYDFKAEKYRKTSRELLYDSPDDWGGGAIINWANRLAKDCSFDPSICEVQKVTEVLDSIYQNS
ncbi:MAG TPA: Gfo/Idh/MocA family oxidoreductase [Chitinispirillaceae bacterium]|nr:Gfo/Idh/MocA family oxidoreductase [Chitinispirillaceae bacterium]